MSYPAEQKACRLPTGSLNISMIFFPWFDCNLPRDEQAVLVRVGFFDFSPPEGWGTVCPSTEPACPVTQSGPHEGCRKLLGLTPIGSLSLKTSPYYPCTRDGFQDCPGSTSAAFAGPRQTKPIPRHKVPHRIAGLLPQAGMECVNQ